MSVIRRPAGVTYNFESGKKIENFVIERPTLLKTESLKRYFEDHYQKVAQDADDRVHRYTRVLQQLEQHHSLTKEQKESFFKQFVLEESRFTRLMRTRFKAERYERIKLIGRGGYGEVWLSADKTTSEIVALKVLRKGMIIMDDQVANVRSEREVLAISNNPWIVELKCSFQDSHFLYLVLEFVQGGDMMGMLMKLSTLQLSYARFYIAEIALAVHSVHELGYVHRDLKPDNILIAANGHLKLADFGLATNYSKPDNTLKELLEQLQDLINEQKFLFEQKNQNGGRLSSEKSATTENVQHQQNVGVNNAIYNRPHHTRPKAYNEAVSIDYSAPEILLGEEPSTASDFWSLGIILYEMLFGFVPFYGKNARDSALRIIHFQEALRFYPKICACTEAIDLILHLLCYPKERFTFEEIVNHPFLKGYDFQSPEFNTPPQIPAVSSPIDTSHFDEMEPMPTETGGNIPLGTDLPSFAFLGFTYKQRPQNTVLKTLDIFNDDS